MGGFISTYDFVKKFSTFSFISFHLFFFFNPFQLSMLVSSICPLVFMGVTQRKIYVQSEVSSPVYFSIIKPNTIVSDQNLRKSKATNNTFS
jgi:hypothetical protein